MPEAFPTIVQDFGYSPIAPALWRTDTASGLVKRDLSLDQASKQVLLGQHLRAAGVVTKSDALIPADAPFVFLFVLAGRVTLAHDGGVAQLNQLDTATRYGTGGSVALGLSQDAEIILMQGASGADDIFGNGGDGSWTFSAENEDVYISGDGPRKFFKYRDLGVADATQRRIHIHIVRATEPSESGGTGWHSHSMGQLFYVLRGWADLAVQNRPSVRMLTGDAMCLGARMKHDVPAFSRDYLVLEMCIPADYDTVDTVAD